ncbi:sensor histidine kinase [Clostridium magnum]|uniref:histidine kinase n=1 Tax=Clostridium magnum DSM 2767 TaxID=1121326 RepID=A0A161X3D0_9CLOT|nr:HAMP domain-containing sensor histidine kinase [Clostridium magnum]KZL93988.1 sensor histidine kinase CssS [Clostridium magnum DSM 2767]SHH99916.1 Signal transduction histidine kinase [Clostridium magnum DSM 2767]
MRTIRTKLFVLFSIFMVLLVLCGILLNAFFLERYYIYKNRAVFIETSKKISEEYVNNRKNIANFINLIDRVDGISCIITDREQSVKYNSFPQKPGPDAMRLPGEIEQLALQNENKLLRKYVYSVVSKPNDQAPKLVFISRLDNGDLIILRKPLKGINESVSIANQFYIFAGLVLILLGGIFIFIFSKTITRPVIEMSKVAEGISNLEFNKRVLYDSDDELGSLGKSINKISEKLSDSMDALKQDVERRKQLVRNISHELKTPIGVIKGYAEGLKYGVADDAEKTQKYCIVIAEECNRMDNMVRELLNLSMLEAGLFQLNISKFDVGGVIQKLSERFEAVFVEKDITLHLNIQKNLVVDADYELLERVVNNYITNAINHAEGMKYIKVTVEKKDNGVRVSVFNTGKHIPENDLVNIWDVFYKIDKSRARQYGGHGLGLSIVRLIAELHGGITGVENVDDGVLFFIEIP